MTNPNNVTIGCQLVGEYIDEAECPSSLSVHGGEAVRPTIVADHLDVWEPDNRLTEFTVLLKDGRVIAVRGHGLKHEPHSLAGQDVFSVVVRTPTEEVLVAVFKSAEVAGIFRGELRADRKIA